MPKLGQFLFGQPPFRFLAEHIVRDEDFLTKSRRILNVSQDAFSRLADRLSTSNDFLDRAALIALTEEELGGGDDVRDLATSIYEIGGVLNGADKTVDEAMDELGSIISEKVDGLEPDERSALIKRLRALAAKPIGLAKQFKAKELVEANGSQLDKLLFLCDIRPIFDESREYIEGYIPLTTMRLDYTLADGDSGVIELRVTEKQLKDFEEKLEFAKRKLASIKSQAARHCVPIPRTKATIVEEE